MSTKIRRATRRHRCARCGFAATYPNAGAVEARYWFDRHSCQKRERLMLREVMAEIREAAIDRTPKPCLHKVAEHVHGTRACYVLDVCRCIPCSKANAAAENERERMKAYGRYHKYVDAYPVRLHVRELMDFGIGLKRIVIVAGVPQGVLWKLMYGKKKPDGSQTPSRRVLRTTAEALYAVEPVVENLADGAMVDGTEAIIRLRSLVALGWSMSKIADRLGIAPGNMTPVIHNRRRLTIATIKAADALFEELAMTLPPRDDHRDKIAYSRSIRYAAKHGWAAPLDLDDLAGEDEQDVSDVDEVAVLRSCDGDRSVTPTAAERQEVIRRLHARGLTDRQVSDLTGIKDPGNERKRLGLPVNRAGIDWSEYGEGPRGKAAS